MKILLYVNIFFSAVNFYFVISILIEKIGEDDWAGLWVVPISFFAGAYAAYNSYKMYRYLNPPPIIASSDPSVNWRRDGF